MVHDLNIKIARSQTPKELLELSSSSHRGLLLLKGAAFCGMETRSRAGRVGDLFLIQSQILAQKGLLGLYS